ncbi:Imm21 family immunity protein [Streptomyces sp. ISL-10]|uniref:Imm21 family immunity protein n=1 Tax=Streptomyces sp. ISL-10 TaxID=2819172 RepID=UPI0035AC1115
MRQSHALVLGDEPASTAFLPDLLAFVRWSAAPIRSRNCWAASMPPSAMRCGRNRTSGTCQAPGVLFDSAWPGAELEPHNHVRVDIPPGPYLVRAAQVTPTPRTSFSLVQLAPLT